MQNVINAVHDALAHMVWLRGLPHREYHAPCASIRLRLEPIHKYGGDTQLQCEHNPYVRPILVRCDLGVRDALAHAVWRGECAFVARCEKKWRGVEAYIIQHGERVPGAQVGQRGVHAREVLRREVGRRRQNVERCV